MPCFSPNRTVTRGGVDAITEMRQALRRRATELSLPLVTLTLVAESERDAIDAFAL